MTRNDTASEFATVTVNLLSQPKSEETEGGQQQRNDNTDDDLAMQDINEEDGSDKEDIKEEEELEETESEDSEHESQFRRSKTPLKTAPREHVTLVPLLALPNISLACPKCSLNVNICHVRTHRDFHTALQTFKFAQNFRPQTLKTLIKRRKVVIKKLQESSPQNNGKAGFADKNLQKINTAFEILKSELEGTGNAFRVLETELDPQINKLYNMELSCTLAVSLCEESNSRWKNMEDTHAYQDTFLEDPRCCFMGIYDGYCGNVTAQKCAKFLHVFLKDELEERRKLNPHLSKERISTAFKQAYYKFQKMLLKTTEDEEKSRSRWSGCSALTCLLTSDACCFANAGNVGALLVRANGIVKVLASRHDLYNKKERDRVRRYKGVIVKTEKCALINGALGTTRGLGNIGDVGLNHCIIIEPKFKYVKLLETDQVIVLASSGLWKMFSYDETSHLVFGFFGKVKRNTVHGIVYGNSIPSLREDGRLGNEHEEVYDRMENRHKYFKQFVRPKTSSQLGRHSSMSFFQYIRTIEEEKKPSLRVSLQIPPWTKNLGRRMSDTCLHYQGNSLHGNEDEEQLERDDEDFDEEIPSHCSLKRRHSLPDQLGLTKLHLFSKTDFTLTRKDKERLLAKYLAKRLARSQTKIPSQNLFRGGTSDKEKYFLEIRDQEGRTLSLPEHERKALALAMTLDEKGKSTLKQKNYAQALLYLLEADKEFRLCRAEILNAVDNYAILCMDVVWCYLCLKSIEDLPDAENRLRTCQACFEKSYGPNLERLRAVQGGTGREVALFVRLHTLQAVCAYHSGQYETAMSVLNKAENEMGRLRVGDSQLTQLVAMGFSVREARLGLRACDGDVTNSIDYISRRKQPIDVSSKIKTTEFLSNYSNDPTLRVSGKLGDSALTSAFNALMKSPHKDEILQCFREMLVTPQYLTQIVDLLEDACDSFQQEKVQPYTRDGLKSSLSSCNGWEKLLMLLGFSFDHKKGRKMIYPEDDFKDIVFSCCGLATALYGLTSQQCLALKDHTPEYCDPLLYLIRNAIYGRNTQADDPKLNRIYTHSSSPGKSFMLALGFNLTTEKGKDMLALPIDHMCPLEDAYVAVFVMSSK
ncbi:hypothetical protein QZH41_007921 [Actinostola sp. cb2023]|nr:hypothetical protein QZH41_007921 [Actinostola sp. cb2023]